MSATAIYNGLPVSSGYAAAASPAGAAPSAAAAPSQQSFQQLFSTMLLAGSLGSSGNAADGAGSTNLLAPLFMILMEQLLQAQLESGSTTGENGLMTTAPGSEIPTGRPVDGRLTQGARQGHMALDFGIPVGTPVQATHSGQVVYASWNDQGYGNLVIVENGPYRTLYAHLSEIPVQVGQRVQAGSIVGLSGNTGNSTGPHLHYEIRRDQVAIDPTGMTLSG